MSLPTTSRAHFFKYTLAALLCLFAVAPPPAATAQQTSAVAGAQAASPTTPPGTLRFPVIVVNSKGDIISGLTRDEFTVWEGKVERDINYFEGGTSPASVAVLVDGSGSMRPRLLSAARYAAARLLGQSQPSHEYLVGEFSDKWRGLMGWVRDARAVAAAADNLTAAAASAAQSKTKGRGPTSLYDACDAMLDALAGRPNRRRVLVLITDGHDTQSRLSLDKLRRKVKEADVQIYAIGINGTDEGGFPNFLGQAVLDELAGVSAGRAYFSEKRTERKDMEEMVDRIALELRHHYIIGFTPTNAARGGKWNKVKIKVTPRDPAFKNKNLYVRSRAGYFSPPAP